MNTVKTFLIGFFGTMTVIMFSTLWTEVSKNLALQDRIEALREDVKNVRADLRSEKLLVELCEQELAKYEKPQPPTPSAAVMTWLFGPPTVTFESFNERNERKCINVR